MLQRDVSYSTWKEKNKKQKNNRSSFSLSTDVDVAIDCGTAQQ